MDHSDEKSGGGSLHVKTDITHEMKSESHNYGNIFLDSTNQRSACTLGPISKKDVLFMSLVSQNMDIDVEKILPQQFQSISPQKYIGPKKKRMNIDKSNKCARSKKLGKSKHSTNPVVSMHKRTLEDLMVNKEAMEAMDATTATANNDASGYTMDTELDTIHNNILENTMETESENLLNDLPEKTMEMELDAILNELPEKTINTELHTILNELPGIPMETDLVIILNDLFEKSMETESTNILNKLSKNTVETESANILNELAAGTTETETATIPEEGPEQTVEAALIPNNVLKETQKCEDDKTLNTSSERDSDFEIIYENTQITRAVDSITSYEKECKNQKENQNFKRTKWDLARSIRKIPNFPKTSKQFKRKRNDDVDTEAMEAALKLERILNGEIKNDESCKEQEVVCLTTFKHLNRTKLRTKNSKKDNKNEQDSVDKNSSTNKQPQKFLNEVSLSKEPLVGQHTPLKKKTKILPGANPTPESSPWYYFSKITMKLPNLEKKPGPLYGLKPTIATNLGVDLSFLTDEFLNDALKMIGKESKTLKVNNEISNLKYPADNEPGTQ